MARVPADNAIVSTALHLGATLPESLLTRTWIDAVAAKDWTEAVQIATTNTLGGTVRQHVAQCTNAAVKTAYLNRADVTAEEAFTVCTSERRPGVLDALGRHANHDRGRYIALLARAYRSKPTIGLATTLLEHSGTASLSTVPVDLAVDILILLDTNGTTLTCVQQHTRDLWTSGLRGTHASTVIRSLTSITWDSDAFFWLLVADGRTAEQIHDDTAVWAANNWTGLDVDDMVKAASSVLIAVGRSCGWNRCAREFDDAIRRYIGDAGGDRSIIDDIIKSRSRQVTCETPEPFTSIGADAAAQGSITITRQDDELAEQLAAAVGPLTPRIELDDAHPNVYLAGTYRPGRSFTEVGAQRKAENFLAEALLGPSRAVVTLGWTTAARYTLAIPAETYRHGWTTAATNPSVRTALLALWRPSLPLDGFDNDALASLTYALALARRNSADDYMVNYASGLAIEALVARGRIGDVVWPAISDSVAERGSWWNTPVRLSPATVASVLGWLAERIEACPDPLPVWAVVSGLSPQFTGTASELLAAAADTIGVGIGTDVTTARSPMTVHRRPPTGQKT